MSDNKGAQRFEAIIPRGKRGMRAPNIGGYRIKDHMASEISELRAEAAETRELAAGFDGPARVDLLSYASALEGEAAHLEVEAIQLRESSLRVC